MSQKVLPNNDIINEVIRLLDSVERVILPVKGYSMLPFIIGGQESIELVKPKTVKVGDVVLAWINDKRYVVHRIINIDGDNIQLMGDGNLTDDEYCKTSDVAALAEYVIDRKGRKRYLYTKGQVRASHLWWKLRPLRRWILAIYRRTILKYKTRNIEE